MAAIVSQAIWLVCTVSLLLSTTTPSNSLQATQEVLDFDTQMPVEGIQNSKKYLEKALDLCDCPELATNYNCTCTEPSGTITTPADASSINKQVTLSYFFEGNESSIVSFYFKKSEIPYLGSACSFTIGSTLYTDLDQLTENNVAASSADMPVLVNGYFPFCEYTLYYYTYSQEIEIINVMNSSGVLTAPVDENGQFTYRPNTQILWIFTPEFAASQFIFTYNMLDLGAPYNTIHGADKLNQSMGDFMLIGPGSDVLGGSELMFYGRKEAENLRQVITLGPTSHVFFYSSSNIFNASGFNISFDAIPVEETTTVPSTTTMPKPPEEIQTTAVVQINGVMEPNADINVDVIISNFKHMLADMSNEYLEINGVNFTSEINPRMIDVPRNETKRCNPYECNYDTCVSFNFSVSALYPNGSWIFTRAVLEDMINHPDLQYHLNAFGEDCEICEKPTRNMWMYVGIPVAVVIIGCLISLVVRYMSDKDRRDDARLKYEREVEERLDDQRRRSSADASILGLGGGSIASRGSLNSRRFTMPFPKPKAEGYSDEDSDVGEYQEYNPDIGRVDLREFGIDRDFLADRTAVSYYTNAAFVDDDDDDDIYNRSASRQQQQQQLEEPAEAAETDSEDSDGGAVSFASTRRKKNTSATQVTVPAEVHIPDRLSLQRMSDCGETAL